MQKKEFLIKRNSAGRDHTRTRRNDIDDEFSKKGLSHVAKHEASALEKIIADAELEEKAQGYQTIATVGLGSYLGEKKNATIRDKLHISVFQRSLILL